MTKTNRGMITGFALVGIGGLLVTGCSDSTDDGAEAFPQETIEVIVPFSAGGPTDSVGRALAEGLELSLGNNGATAEVVVVNREGAAGAVGTSEVVNSNPDGYTLTVVTGTSFGVQPHVDSAPYGVDDLTPIAEVASTPNVLVVNSASDIETFEDFVEYAEENPGEFNYGTTGVGSLSHANFAALSYEIGVETADVPFDGNAPMFNALLGENIDSGVVQTFDAIPHLEEGSLRALGVIGTRVPDHPAYEDVPLVSDLGYDVSQDLYFGLMGPVGMDDEVRDSLEAGVQAALEDDGTIERFNALNLEPSFKTGDEFADDIADMGTIVERAEAANGGPLN